ncbi:MAG TPA: HD domain-containing protein [Flavobacteriaceae bacterium]|nr:HD domain-containing protein [Flavobacteriaceae bacterium]
MTNPTLIEKTIAFVKSELLNAEAGHDWFHTQRVYNNALLIAKNEVVNREVVQLAALLHDIADSKFHNGDETIGPRKAGAFLTSQQVSSEITAHVVAIISTMSYRNSLDNSSTFHSKELEVVQDADRLDAIGAIGIARAFHYGGYKNRSIYHPDIPPKSDMTPAEYKTQVSPTLNHFYEKLLLLKEKMNTSTGKKLAEKRHQFMLDYLEQFFNEWNGKV